jgi:hypothetical protein
MFQDFFITIENGLKMKSCFKLFCEVIYRYKGNLTLNKQDTIVGHW